MTELGKKTGPVIHARFKICPNGTTDWVPIVLGARSIDCVERGGLGHSPLDKSHAMAKLGIQMERFEQPYDRIKGSCYGMRSSVVDDPVSAEEDWCSGILSGPTSVVVSDTADEEECILQLIGATVNLSKAPCVSQENASQEAQLPAPLSDEPRGCALVYGGPSIMMEPEEVMWVPLTRVNPPGAPENQPNVPMAVFPAAGCELEVPPGLWQTGDQEEEANR